MWLGPAAAGALRSAEIHPPGMQLPAEPVVGRGRDLRPVRLPAPAQPQQVAAPASTAHTPAFALPWQRAWPAQRDKTNRRSTHPAPTRCLASSLGCTPLAGPGSPSATANFRSSSLPFSSVPRRASRASAAEARSTNLAKPKRREVPGWGWRERWRGGAEVGGWSMRAAAALLTGSDQVGAGRAAPKANAGCIIAPMHCPPFLPMATQV